jgi:hypothetical protein
MRLGGIIAPLPLPVLAEYKACVRLIWAKEIEQRASVEASEMQADFIFFRKMAMIVAAHNQGAIREKD